MLPEGGGRAEFLLFPLDCAGGFAGDVVDDAGDAADFVDDAVADAGEDVVGDSGPVGGHEVGGVDAAEGDDVLVGAAVAHDADGSDGEDRGEGLGGGAVEVFGDDFFEEDFVGVAEDGKFFVGDFADAADGEAGAGEGVSPDDVLGEAEEFADFADFVFEEVAEGFDEIEAEFRGEAADVVMELDVGGGAGVCRGRTR